tara:strand:- start:75 stop:269 length:195 start_codon:yes stop_codon:yes gene_type:complete
VKKEERFYVIDHIKNKSFYFKDKKSFNLWKRDDFNTNRHTIQYDYQDHIKKCQEDGINKKGENV